MGERKRWPRPSVYARRTRTSGLVVTVAMMVAHGILTVLNHDVSPAISGIAGLGHILLSVGFAMFFLCLCGPITTTARVR
ncbi:DUF2871 family protein [Nocardia sp. NPDC004123]